MEKLTEFEVSLAEASILQSIEVLGKDANRNKPSLKENFDKAIKSRYNLIEKIKRINK